MGDTRLSSDNDLLLPPPPLFQARGLELELVEPPNSSSLQSSSFQVFYLRGDGDCGNHKDLCDGGGDDHDHPLPFLPFLSIHVFNG